jgi:hypothetical protein
MVSAPSLTVRKTECRSKDQHAGRQVGEDGFQIAACRLQFGAVALGFAAGIVELAGHAVEGLGQHTQFVAL